MTKYWKRYIGVTVLLLIFLLPAAAGAEERKDEWQQTGYSFATIKSVFVEPVFAEGVQADDLTQRILRDKVNATFSRNLKFARLNLSFMTQDELVKRLSKTRGEDVAALATADPARYQQLVQEGAAFYCDAILQVRFAVYGDTSRHIAEKMETYMTTKEVYLNRVVTDSNGHQTTVNEWVSVPVSEVRVIPEHDEVTSHTALEFELTDAKTKQLVWKMVDSRDAVDKEKDGMIGRILKRAAERLEAVKKS